MAQDGVDEVRLTLPRRYAAFPGPVAAPQVPVGVHLVQVETDLGPGTKLWPALSEARGTVLICDDDWLYGPGWAQGFAEAARANPGAAIAASTFDAGRLGVGAGIIVQGFAGVLLRRDMVPEEAFDPPPEVRNIDDIWLSAMLAAAGTPVVTVPDLRARITPGPNEAAPLQRRTDRAGLNRQAAAMLRDRFGIWT